MSRQKQKGTAFETLIVNWLRTYWFPQAERRALSGTKDKGDIAGVYLGRDTDYPLVVECKNQNRLSLAEWVDEALEEKKNVFGSAAVVIHKRRGKGAPEDQYLTTTVGEFFKIIDDARTAGRLSA